ncbi:TPA: ATP/GTP-binding protein, partial [Serratia marcescens]
MENALLWYEVKNFGSFGSEGGLVDLTTHSRDTHKELFKEVGEHKVNLITAIMGANGSGKTTLLKPIPFLAWLFWKIPEKITDDMYLSANRGVSDFVHINVEFIYKNKTYKYELVACKFFILKETLYTKNLRNQYTYIFKREAILDNFYEIGEELLKLAKETSSKGLGDCLKKIRYSYKEKNNLFTLGILEGERTPCNTSVISSARRLGDELAADMAMFMACNTNVVFSGRKSHGYQDIEKASKYFSKENDVFIRVKRILKKWDLGLDDILIEEEINKDESDEEQVRYHTYGVHKLKDGKSFNLPFVFESAGTKSAYVRLYDILLSLDTGAHCFIDELGDDLHPHMIKPILELFSDRESNPLGAQLV